MNKRLYTITRDLHLYAGLFIAPFVLVFSISVFFLVHTWSPGANGPPGPKRVVSDLAVPADLENLGGRARVDALQKVLAGTGVTGEIGYVGHNVKKRTLRFRLSCQDARPRWRLTWLLARRPSVSATQALAMPLLHSTNRPAHTWWTFA